MSEATAVRNAKDFFILGPTLAKGNKVLEAIHSLYYLPENFKLVFTGAGTVDQDLYGQVVTLVKRDNLSNRVRFTNSTSRSDAIISPRKTRFDSTNSVTGDSAEAIASAILNVARSRRPSLAAA